MRHPKPHVEGHVVLTQRLRIAEGSYGVAVAPREGQRHPEPEMIHGIQRIEYQQAVRGGQAGFGAADEDGERAVLSQHSCIAGRERPRTLVLSKRVRKFEKSGEEIGQRQVAVGEIRRQGDRLARIALRLVEVVVDTRSRHQSPGEIRECDRPAGISEGVIGVRANGLGVSGDGRLQTLFVQTSCGQVRRSVAPVGTRGAQVRVECCRVARATHLDLRSNVAKQLDPEGVGYRIGNVGLERQHVPEIAVISL